MPNKLQYYLNPLKIELRGIFVEKENSAFFISPIESWHVTFVKKDGVIQEELRKITGFKEGFLLVDPTIEYTYRSEFKNFQQLRDFFRKQPQLDNYQELIAQFLANQEEWQISQQQLDEDAPF